MKRSSLLTIRWIVPFLVVFMTFSQLSTSTAQVPSLDAASLAETNSMTEKPAPIIPTITRKSGTPALLSPEGGGGGLCMWSAGPTYPITVLDQGTATQGGFLYSFAGVGNNAVIADSFRFDGTTWTAIAPTPVALEYPAAVSDGTFLYVVCGVDGTGTNQNSLFRYDPNTDSYLALAPCSEATWNQAAVYLSGKIYKFGGTAAAGSTNVLEIYDIASNSWSLGAPYPITAGFISAFVDGGLIYGAGGNNNGTEETKTYCYNPATNTWDDAAIADLPAPRWGGASSGTPFGPGWIIAGGYENAAISATALSWNSGSNTWSYLTNMAGDRARMTGGQLNGIFYAVGGRTNASAGFVGSDATEQLICIENQAFIVSGEAAIVSEDCIPENGVPDPGENMTVSLPLSNIGDIPTVALTATLQATGGVTNPSGPVNYGAVAPGGVPSFGNFSFTVDPNFPCGDNVTLTWTIADGATNYADATTTYSTGIRVETSSENMDGATVPALPAGWASTQTAGTEIFWVTNTTDSFSAPNAAFANEPGTVNAAAMSSPAVVIGSADAQLSFANNYQTETNFDGGVLEFSTDGGATWTDILVGGGSFASGGYNSTISSSFNSPISGRMAWSGNGGGYIDTVVNLPAALNGQSVIFRWLMATDSSVTSTGWWIDNVVVLGANECSECSGVQTVFPDLVATTRGTYVSGDVNDLATSNNTDYVIRRNGTDTIARTELTVSGSSATLSPSSLEVMLEGAVFARSPVVQSIGLFNFISGEYEVIDSRNATNMVDSTVTVAAAGDLSRFVDQATSEVRARVRFQSVNPRQRFSSNTDKFNWMIGQ